MSSSDGRVAATDGALEWRINLFTLGAFATLTSTSQKCLRPVSHAPQGSHHGQALWLPREEALRALVNFQNVSKGDGLFELGDLLGEGVLVVPDLDEREVVLEGLNLRHQSR